MATTNLSLEQPAYLSDGQTAVTNMNANMDIIDSILGSVPIVTLDSIPVEFNGETVFY